jgi:hypothetical protein
MHYVEFARKIKEKNPEYAQINDEELVKEFIAKYPRHTNNVEFGDKATQAITVNPANVHILPMETEFTQPMEKPKTLMESLEYGASIPLRTAKEFGKGLVYGVDGMIAKIPETVERFADNAQIDEHDYGKDYENYIKSVAPDYYELNKTKVKIDALEYQRSRNRGMSKISKGARVAKDWVNEGNKYWEPDERINKSIEDIDGIGEKIVKAGSLAGQGGASLLVGGIGGAGAKLGLKALGMSAKTAGITASGISGLGLATFDTGEYSDLKQKLIEQGKTEAEAIHTANLVMNAQMAGTSFLEKYGLDVVFGKNGKMLSKIIKGFLVEGGTEGLQTIYQNAVEKYGVDKGKQILEGFIDSIVGGSLSGGGMSGISTKLRRANISKQINKSQAMQEEYKQIDAQYPNNPEQAQKVKREV